MACFLLRDVQKSLLVDLKVRQTMSLLQNLKCWVSDKLAEVKPDHHAHMLCLHEPS
jgi:hypothetical protein